MAVPYSKLQERREQVSRPPAALVITDPALAQAPVDWSRWYLRDEDDMGQATEHQQIIDVLLSSLEELARERAWRSVLVASDQFFAWVPDEPLVRVSPDIYVLDDPPPPPYPASWQTWQPGHRPPRFAVEITSDTWTKDYEDNPPKYAQLGTAELVIADPGALATPDDRRFAFQVYRRQADGAFVRVAAGPGPVYCQEIDAHLSFARSPDTAWRVRISRDAQGRDLVPTAAERADAAEERADAAEERAAAAERLLREHGLL